MMGAAMKTAAQAYAKWQAGTQAASGPNGSWAENLNSTTKPIVDAAIAQEAVMVSNFNRAVQDGKYRNALRAVGDSGIKAAARAKADNYGVGTAANSPGATKYQRAITAIIAYEQQNLPTIYNMPKGTLQAGINRMTEWARIMAAGAGSFTG
jgi:hypothetical protein